MSEAFAYTNPCTEEDYYNLPENVRSELIDGQMYYMAAPRRIHQEILSFLHLEIGSYIRSKGGSCKVYPAPFAVKLFEGNDETIVEPDISAICDQSKLDDKGRNGAPDWIIEIISPSTERIDCGIKLFKYHSAGVREYWIINPRIRIVSVYDFERNENTCQYAFEDTIPVCIYNDFSINIASLLL